jgi:CheY-like chemotaxis protein
MTAVPAACRRVLVVEDSADAAATLATLLALWGHHARAAPDGPSALALFPSFQPDVVLVDLMLPGMNGQEVARRLRALAGPRGVWLIALTGLPPQAQLSSAYDAGFDLYLVKPYDPEGLRRLLAAAPLRPPE